MVDLDERDRRLENHVDVIASDLKLLWLIGIDADNQLSRAQAACRSQPVLQNFIPLRRLSLRIGPVGLRNFPLVNEKPGWRCDLLVLLRAA